MFNALRPISLFILSVLLYFFFIQPNYEEVKGIRAETADYNQAVKEYDTFNNKLNAKLDLKKQQNPVTIERLNQLVPENIGSAQIIADIEQMALKHNLLFGNISTDAAGGGQQKNKNASGNTQLNANTELQTADISFDVIGTYDQFKEFLLEVESSLTLLEVTSLSFVASDGLFEQFSLTVRAYALPQISN